MTKKQKWLFVPYIILILIWLYAISPFSNGLYPRTEDGSGCTEAPALYHETGLIKALSYDEVEMEVTGYCPCEICCGIFADWVTASGRPAKGFLLAAPPKYPFRTFMAVEGYAEGKFVPVLDRGVAITGNRLDLLFPDHNLALDWGRQIIKVKVLKESIEQ